MTIEINATCDCGAIRFKSIESPIIQLACHCSDCRDATNNDFSEIAFFNFASVQIEGDVSSKQYVANSKKKTERDFCPSCGDLMFDRSDGFPELIGVFISKLAMPFAPSIDAHMWVKSKVRSVSIPAGANKYEGELA